MARKKKEEKIGLPRAKPNRREREISYGPYGGTVPRLIYVRPLWV